MRQLVAPSWWSEPTLLPDLSSPATTPTPTVRPSLSQQPSPSTSCQVGHLSPRTAASTGHPLPGPGPSPRARHVSATSKLNRLPTCPSAGVRGTGWDRCRFHVKPERRSTWARTCQRPHPPGATATRRSRREGENPLSSRRDHSPGRSSPSVKPPSSPSRTSSPDGVHASLPHAPSALRPAWPVSVGTGDVTHTLSDLSIGRPDLRRVRADRHLCVSRETAPHSSALREAGLRERQEPPNTLGVRRLVSVCAVTQPAGWISI